MAAAAKISQTQTTQAERCVELAREHHLEGTARYLGTNDVGARLWRVPSRSSDAIYLVTYWPLAERYMCVCQASCFGRPCGHIGAAMAAEKQRREAEAFSSRLSAAFDNWLKGWEW